MAESVIAYQLTWSTVTSTSQGKCRLAANPTLVNISTVTNNSSGAGTDHNTLSNLQGGTIGEYYHLTSAEKTTVDNLTNGVAVATDILVPDEAYGAGWNGSLEVPTKNALYDKIETIAGGGTLQTIYDASTPSTILTDSTR